MIHTVIEDIGYPHDARPLTVYKRASQSLVNDLRGRRLHSRKQTCSLAGEKDARLFLHQFARCMWRGVLPKKMYV